MTAQPGYSALPCSCGQEHGSADAARVVASLGSTAAALLGPVIFSFIPANWPVLAGLGLVCGFTGIVGDLFESALKRTAGVKDSGKIIPGRGGFLDSFDSILFSALPFLIALLLLKIL